MEIFDILDEFVLPDTSIKRNIHINGMDGGYYIYNSIDNLCSEHIRSYNHTGYEMVHEYRLREQVLIDEDIKDLKYVTKLSVTDIFNKDTYVWERGDAYIG